MSARHQEHLFTESFVQSLEKFKAQGTLSEELYWKMILQATGYTENGLIRLFLQGFKDVTKDQDSVDRAFRSRDGIHYESPQRERQAMNWTTLNEARLFNNETGEFLSEPEKITELKYIIKDNDKGKEGCFWVFQLGRINSFFSNAGHLDRKKYTQREKILIDAIACEMGGKIFDQPITNSDNSKSILMMRIGQDLITEFNNNPKLRKIIPGYEDICSPGKFLSLLIQKSLNCLVGEDGKLTFLIDKEGKYQGFDEKCLGRNAAGQTKTLDSILSELDQGDTAVKLVGRQSKALYVETIPLPYDDNEDDLPKPNYAARTFAGVGIFFSLLVIAASIPLVIASCGVSLPVTLAALIVFDSVLTSVLAGLGLTAGVSSVVGFSLFAKKFSYKQQTLDQEKEPEVPLLESRSTI